MNWGKTRKKLVEYLRILEKMALIRTILDVKIIASIEDPAVIQKILAHLNDRVTSVAAGLLPDCRDPPMRLLV